MNKILSAMAGHEEYMLLCLVVILLALVATFFMNLFSKQLKFFKYLPGLSLIMIGMVSLLLVLNALFAASSLNNVLVAVICISAGLCSLIFALIIGILTK